MTREAGEPRPNHSALNEFADRRAQPAGAMYSLGDVLAEHDRASDLSEAALVWTYEVSDA